MDTKNETPWIITGFLAVGCVFVALYDLVLREAARPTPISVKNMPANRGYRNSDILLTSFFGRSAIRFICVVTQSKSLSFSTETVFIYLPPFIMTLYPFEDFGSIKRKPRVLTASSDATVVAGFHPAKPTTPVWLVENKNEKSGILVTIRIDGTLPGAVLINVGNPAIQRQWWPIRTDIFVPPRQKTLACLKTLYVTSASDWGTDPPTQQRTEIAQTVTVEYADYSNEPIPPYLEAPTSFFWCYNSPILNSPDFSYSLHFVNIHSTKGLYAAGNFQPDGLGAGIPMAAACPLWGGAWPVPNHFFIRSIDFT